MQVYLKYQGFLGRQLNHQLYKLAISKENTYTPSRTSYSKYYPEWRKSVVIYDSQFALMKEMIEAKIRARLAEIHQMLAIRPFEIDCFEVQLTSHNDGDYFKWHTDNGSPNTASRQITFVYYFNGTPKAFSGGELILYDNDESHIVEPDNDSIVFFASGRKHEVRQVACPSKLFRDGRFTLNGWIRTKYSRKDLDNSYFGYNIFSPLAGYGK